MTSLPKARSPYKKDGAGEGPGVAHRYHKGIRKPKYVISRSRSTHVAVQEESLCVCKRDIKLINGQIMAGIMKGRERESGRRRYEITITSIPRLVPQPITCSQLWDYPNTLFHTRVGSGELSVNRGELRRGLTMVTGVLYDVQPRSGISRSLEVFNCLDATFWTCPVGIAI